MKHHGSNPQVAAARLARLVWRGDAAPHDAPAPLERRWLGGIEEASDLLRELTGLEPHRGPGLGGALPWVESGALIVVCGAPVAAGPVEVQGPDGIYRVAQGAVRREAAGVEEILLTPGAPIEEGTGPGFDLLWFGDSERYVVRGGRVEIEDLFCRVEAPVDRSWLDRMAVRRRGAEASVLEGLDLEPAPGRARLEVRRCADLTGPGWDDPERLVSVREDVVRVEVGGGEISVEFACGERAAGPVHAVGDGWEASFAGGVPWRRLWCHREGGNVVYGVEPLADPRDAGVRTRWAFDLISDLLRLGSGRDMNHPG